MRCICRCTCQTRVDGGQIRFFKRGEIWEFDECPPHFESLDPVEGAPPVVINFDTAERDELLAVEYDVAELREYLKVKYNKVTTMSDKEKLVDMMLDARFRAID